ncbi:MAG: methyltransferase domain-containing protein [Planctomycetota bacterium]
MDSAPLDWQQAYVAGTTPWDLRRATPPLADLLASPLLASVGLGAGARVAVPGCGRGHDVREFGRHGFDVTGFDLAPSAVDEARRLLELNRARARVLCRDVFGLLPEFSATFQLAYDYTFYCALRPPLRPAYARTLAGILAPGGMLLHLTFPMRSDLAGKDGRPPFLVTAQDLRTSFEPLFDLVRELPASGSVPERVGAEHWYLWRKRVR